MELEYKFEITEDDLERLCWIVKCDSIRLNRKTDFYFENEEKQKSLRNCRYINRVRMVEFHNLYTENLRIGLHMSDVFRLPLDKKEYFSLSDEQIYLNELEYDLNLAKQYIAKYYEGKERNKNASIIRLCNSLGVQSVSPGIMDALVEERGKKGSYKASDIASRINEARVNLYLREQKEKALSDASKAKSEILGAVLNHLDLEETKTDIFAAI